VEQYQIYNDSECELNGWISILTFFTIPYGLLMAMFKYYFYDRHDIALLLDLELLKNRTYLQPEFMLTGKYEVFFKTANLIVFLAPILLFLNF
jgi:hypothetical protein